jgi:Recombination endonuclease VII
MKKCFYCKIDKPVTSYSICRKTKDGLYSTCKECTSIRGKEKRESGHKFVSRARKIELGLISSITCTLCNTRKLTSEYNVHDSYRCIECNKKRQSDSYYADHERSKEKKKENSKKRYFSSVEVRRKFYLKSKFNISSEDYNEMLVKSNHACEICEKPDATNRHLSVDHNHITGIVRGLLCTRCNAAIGSLNTDIGVELLQNAIEYIRRTEAI